MMMVWMSLVTGRTLSLVGFGVLVDQRAGDLLVFELVAAALDLGQVDGLVGPVVAGAPRQVRAEAAVEVGQLVGGVLHPLAGHLEAEALEDVPEDGGADEAGLRPRRVVDLGVVLLDRRLVGPQPRGVLVVG